MIDQRLSSLQGIIWDKDGTMFEETPELIREYQLAAIGAIVQMVEEAHRNDPEVPLITMEEAEATIPESYSTYGWSFELLRRRYNFGKRTVHFKMHTLMTTKNVKPNPCLPTALLCAKQQGIKMGIATHCNMVFVRTNLAHMNIGSDIIEDRHIMTLEECDFAEKTNSDHMIMKTAHHMGVLPHQSAFVENSTGNLILAKQRGFLTVLVTWGRPVEEYKHLEHVDLVCETPVEFLRMVTQAKKLQPAPVHARTCAITKTHA